MNTKRIAQRVQNFLNDPANEPEIAKAVALEIARKGIPGLFEGVDLSEGEGAGDEQSGESEPA